MPKKTVYIPNMKCPECLKTGSMSSAGVAPSRDYKTAKRYHCWLCNTYTTKPIIIEV